MSASGTESVLRASEAVARQYAAALFGWLGRRFVAERERWILWLPVLLGVGIALYFAMPGEPPAWPAPAALLLAAAVGVFGRRRTMVLLATLAVASVALGFAAADYRAKSVAAPVLEKRTGPVTVTARIREVSVLPDGGRRLVLDHPTIGRLPADETPKRVRVRLRGKADPNLASGDWVKLLAILLPPPEPAAPGAFDFARRAWFQQLGAVGFAVGRPIRVARRDADQGDLGTFVAGLRQDVSARVRAALPGPQGAVAAALMTGDRGAIPPEVMQAMRDAGLAHLLAISGLHIGLVAALAFFAVRAVLALIPPLALRYPIKKWAAVPALIVSLGYLVLTGATVPTQRAFLMTCLVLLAIVMDRSALSMRLVAWARRRHPVGIAEEPAVRQFSDVLRCGRRADRGLRGGRRPPRRMAR